MELAVRNKLEGMIESVGLDAFDHDKRDDVAATHKTNRIANRDKQAFIFPMPPD
jgi:hypothetical protein